MVGSGKIGPVIPLSIKIIEQQVDIVPRIVEKYKGIAVDFLHIGAFSGMSNGGFHLPDVNIMLPARIDDL